MRLRIRVRGIVQGVGFRPFVYKLAQKYDVKGFVQNTSEGVLIEAEVTGANAKGLDRFLSALKQESPTNSRIFSIEIEECSSLGEETFAITESGYNKAETVLLPDLGTCADCLKEMNDVTNRRYKYSFTNCTQCGPRYSIIDGIPYDRARTTMNEFIMCKDCQHEYENPADRRFHAEPNACLKCGPQLTWLDANGATLAQGNTCVSEVARAVIAGKIIAVKGIGGFHLVVDATNEAAVKLLRARKHREEKPFAVMFPDIERVREHCIVSKQEEALLISPQAPIILLKRKTTSNLSHVSPGNPYTGVFLPYSPLHHLLLKEIGRPIVATSGNKTDERICIDNDEAVERLAGIADYFLVHDRQIARHVDDSVVRTILGETMLMRPGRGYAPCTFQVDVSKDKSTITGILAVGAQLKNTIALGVAKNAIQSQHIGDLDHAETFTSFDQVIHDISAIYGGKLLGLVCDKHPEYMSTRYAKARVESMDSENITFVQHHYAHALSCMLDNDILHNDSPVLAVTWDGTGYGDDGTIWGGEFLKISKSEKQGYSRAATLRSFKLPGGDAAIKHVNRIAYSMLAEISAEASAPTGLVSSHEQKILSSMLEKNVNSPITTSAGRVFDGVAALLGICHEARFEGQAAMLLEYAIEATEENYSVNTIDPTDEKPITPIIIDWEPMINAIITDINGGVRVGVIAGKFHNTMVEAIITIARKVNIKAVCLTGGCFQNKYLAERAITKLRENGFTPYWHHNIPPNDAGIALGQLAAVALGTASGSVQRLS